MNDRIIPDNTKIYRFDGVDATTVYTGSFDSLEKAELIWHIDKEMACITETYGEWLTLDEIAHQLKGKTHMITIFVDQPLHGEIWQYGNYNDGTWYRIGETIGYA